MALNGHLLTLLVFFSAVGALALLCLRGEDHVWIRRLALVVSGVELRDTSPRENSMLWVLAVVILWMGVNPTFFTRRFAAPCKTVLQQMNPNVMQEAAAHRGTVQTDGATERLALR
jgi:NADH:ubiquinone oxidoreductase subunit 4 (subunit M)